MLSMELTGPCSILETHQKTSTMTRSATAAILAGNSSLLPIFPRQEFISCPSSQPGMACSIAEEGATDETAPPVACDQRHGILAALPVLAQTPGDTAPAFTLKTLDGEAGEPF